MSLDYYARKGLPFGVNTSGADLLGYINRLAGARVSKFSLLWEARGLGPRTVYTATAEEARADATKIAALSDEQLRGLLEAADAADCWGGAVEEFVAFAREWQAFLEQCEGYDTDPTWPMDEEGRALCPGESGRS